MKTLQELRTLLLPVCQDQPAIMAAYIFGSVAQGRAKSSSDVDMAVLLSDEAHSEAFSLLRFIIQLENILECQVDVVVLNTTHEVLKYQVRHTGKLIFDRAPQFRKNFEIRSRKAYEDFLYLHKLYVSKVLYGGR